VPDSRLQPYPEVQHKTRNRPRETPSLSTRTRVGRWRRPWDPRASTNVPAPAERPLWLRPSLPPNVPCVLPRCSRPRWGDDEAGPGRGIAQLLAEARHRRLRGRPVERQDAAVHRLIGGSGYRLGYAGCHSQRLVLRRPLGDRDGQHASDCRLPGAGRLPPFARSRATHSQGRDTRRHRSPRTGSSPDARSQPAQRRLPGRR